LRQGFTTEADIDFYCPKYVVLELFKHKERIAASTAPGGIRLLGLLHSLLNRIRSMKTPSIGSWTEAWRLCRDVDENDVA
jgi:predicted nucleic acid-binding protein